MSGTEQYRVVAVEPDDRYRTRLTIQLAGVSSTTYDTLEALVDSLVPGEPTVVVFGPGLANETGLAHVDRLTGAFPETGVVLLSHELTMPFLQQALRAGARDALLLDADESSIRQATARVGTAMAALAARSATVAEPARHGRVVVAFSTKGGVGKSVVATNLGVSLATRGGGKVALVDADLQFGDVAVLLGVPPVHTVVEAAGSIDTADQQLIEGLLGTHEASGLRVLPAPIEPSAGNQISPREMIAIIQLMRGMFDFVIVDMPPHFDDLVLALLEEADDVLVVASMDIPSIKNLKVGIQTLDLLTVAGAKMRLVLNRSNARVNLDVSDVERALGVPAEFRIPSDISIPQSVNRGVPVVIDRPRSASALALTALADWFLGEGVAGEEPTEAESARRRGRRRGR